MKNTIVLYPNTNHFYKFVGENLSLPEYSVKAYGLYRFHSKVGINFVRAVELLKRNCESFTFGKWKNVKDANVVILFDLVGFIDVMKTVDSNLPNARKILYLWNININPERLEYASSHGWEIWSFDKENAKKKDGSIIISFTRMYNRR